MSRVGAQYKSKGELTRISSDELGDDFIGPFYDPVTTQEFTSTIKSSSDKFIDTGVPPFEKVIYFSEEGNDDDEGTRIVKPKKTLDACLSAAILLGPSSTNQISIVCLDGSIISPIVTIPSFVNLMMPYGKAIGDTGRLFTMEPFSSALVRQVELTGTAIGFHKETGLGALVDVDAMTFMDDSVCVNHAGNSVAIVANIRASEGTGTMVRNTSGAFGRCIVVSSVVSLTDPSAMGVDQRSDENDTLINCDVLGTVPGAPAVDMTAPNTGVVTATIRDIIGDLRVPSGNTLNIDCNNHAGSVLGDGTLKGTISDTVFSGIQLEDEMRFTSTGHIVNAISNDQTLADASPTDLITEFAAKKYADSFCIQRGYISINPPITTMGTSFITVGVFTFNSITQSLDEMFAQWTANGSGKTIEVRVVYSSDRWSTPIALGSVRDTTELTTIHLPNAPDVLRTIVPVPSEARMLATIATELPA